MGKKQVAEKTKEQVVAEARLIEEKHAQRVSKSAKKRYEKGKVYIKASFNNTFITVTDMDGNVITWMTAGSLGFSGPKKATPFAAAKVVEALAEKLQRTGPFEIEIYLKGVGSGRDSAVRTFGAKGFTITAIKDITPIPHNGPRAKKVRRV